MYYKLSITKTSKPMGRPKNGNFNDWSTYDKEIKEFKTIDELKAYLAEQYYYCKTKYKTFNDNAEGQQGWIYAFKSGYGGENWFEQHWINAYKINSKPVLI